MPIAVVAPVATRKDPMPKRNCRTISGTWSVGHSQMPPGPADHALQDEQARAHRVLGIPKAPGGGDGGGDGGGGRGQILAELAREPAQTSDSP